MIIQIKTSPRFVWSSILQGVVGEGPGAGGGAELLAAGQDITTAASADEEAILGVILPCQHLPGKLARGGGGGEEHLHRVNTRHVGSLAPGYAPGYHDGWK